MLTYFDSVILGVIEGFTEFLPISSTAHLMLAAHALGISQTAFAKTFEIAIQSGAILAVVVLYWRAFLRWELLKRIVVAFVPTAVIGLALYKAVKTYLLGDLSIALWSLAIGGAVLIIFERLIAARQAQRREQDQNADAGLEQGLDRMTYRQAALIGICQSVAIIPGVSRSAATVVGGMLLGMSRTAIVEFSFLLAAPTMAAATALDLYKSYGQFSGAQFGTLALGFAIAFITAVFGIKFLLRYVRRRTFTGFGIYRIALVAAILLYMLV